ncbi:MAG: HEPN domain-containing protein [Planctomycetota bacterium]
MSARESAFRRWLAKAASDRLDIENNLRSPTVPWDTVCFHAQQAAEKALKAFLVFPDCTPPRTHDSVAVLTECARIDATLSPLEPDCQRLTYYAVGARYPDDLYEPDEAAGRAMVAASQRVWSAVLTRLPDER